MASKEEALRMGNATPKFTQLCKDNDIVANFMDEMMSEEDFVNISIRKIKKWHLLYGFIALNWHLSYGLNYEIVYVKFLEKSPNTQEEFDNIQTELDILPKKGQQVN